MRWSTTVSLAGRGLSRNRVRTGLATLGVIIGVASVIAMVSVGAGAQQRIASQLVSLGSHNLVIRPGTITRGGVRTGAGSTTSLTTKDAEAIKKLPGVLTVDPTVRTAVQARHRGINWGTAVEGATASFTEARNWSVATGEFFSERDVASASHVCVLGQTVAREMFGLMDPVGETLVFKGLACRVTGVLEGKGATAWGTDRDDTIVMPLTTVQRKLLGITHLHRIEIQTAGSREAEEAATAVKQLLRERHRLRVGQDDDFRIYNRAELAASAQESARVFTWLLGSIASVSLLVGGIGIMNIMLVSVTERTREIGIRMALGARRRDIRWQFLLESMMLSGTGGVVGIAFGLLSAVLISRFSELPVSVAPWSVGVAFLFAVFVGVFFGLHPARKAARLRPIEALRYE